MKKFDIKNLTKEFKSAIDTLVKTKDDNTYTWSFGQDDQNCDYWAIVLGWTGGFDLGETDEYQDGGFHICAKLARQPYNAAMQSSYEMDWEMPYDEETGEVFDTEVIIYKDSDIEEIISDFISNMETIAKEFKLTF